VGGGVTEPGVLEACWEALPTGGRLVANAVTLQGEAMLAEWRGGPPGGGEGNARAPPRGARRPPGAGGRGAGGALCAGGAGAAAGGDVGGGEAGYVTTRRKVEERAGASAIFRISPGMNGVRPKAKAF